MAVTWCSLFVQFLALFGTLVPLCLCIGNSKERDLAASEDTVILVTDWSTPGRILNVSLQNMNFTTVQTDLTRRPVALDYDPEGNRLYWTDVLQHQIRRTDIRTGEDIVLAQLNSGSTPDGLAVDLDEGAIFYTDTGNNLVAKFKLVRLISETILSTDLQEPRAIITYREKRMIYWTDWGINPKIERATYEGRKRRTLVSTGLVWPNGLTMDEYNARLYWCDAKTSMIESVDLHGDNRRVVLSEPLAHYFGIFYHQGLLYFTDWRRSNSLLHVPACGGKVGSLKSKGFRHLAGVHVVSSSNTGANNIAIECAYTCSHCKTGCNMKTGRCTGGCTDGWTGNECNTVVEHISTEPTRFISNKVTSKPTEYSDLLGSGDDSNSTDFVTPASTISRTRQDTHITIGMAAYVGLGCVAFLLLIATVSLAVIYINRRIKEKETYNNLEQVRQQAFSNNTYTLMSSDLEDRSQVYLVPLEDQIKQLDDSDHFYEDIDEMKK